MKIQKEELNSLNQLDRIEYRLRKKEIEEIDFSLGPLHWYLILVGFVSSIYIFLVTGSTINSLEVCVAFIKLSLIIVIINFVLIGIEYLKQKKELNKLNKEYFEIKKKK